MNIFDGSFLESLKEAIIVTVQNAVETMSSDREPEKRYLQKKDARQYIGGIDPNDFTKLIAMELPEIKVGRSIRYDKKDIDVFMAKHRY